MKKKTCKIIICVAMFMLIFSSFTSIFADTNPDYTPSVQISENALDTKIKGSVLLDALANMINAIASLAEYLIGAIFSALTGDNIFPWADRIIFNGIGFLDINFLNPASNSLFVQNGQDSILGQVVKSVYSTVFSLAVLFLGVAVGVMAIRLAISSIAAEKAKYKQAIVNWATCIVMLFLMHYILAFVFWVNEQLVRLASGILIQTIESRELNSVDFSKALNSVITPEERVKNFIEASKSKPSDPVGLGQNIGEWAVSLFSGKTDASEEKLLSDNAEITNNLLINSWYVNNRLVYVEDNTENWGKAFGQNWGFTHVMMTDIGVPRLARDVADAAAVKSFVDPPSTNDSQKLKEHQEKLAQQRKKGYYDGADGRKLYFDKEAYLKSDEYKVDVAILAHLHSVSGEASKIYGMYIQYPGFRINTGDNPNYYQMGFNSIWSLISGNISGTVNDMLNNQEAKNYIATVIKDKSLQSEIADQRLKVDQIIISAATGVKSTTTDIIANLGQFFKQSAYIYTTKEVSEGTNEEGKKTVITGWRASELSVTGALLYAIFIFQSCMYLLMYVKRLFYVMMLSMFGPIVVIYDFFTKSAGS